MNSNGEYFEIPGKLHCCKTFCFGVIASLAELLDYPSYFAAFDLLRTTVSSGTVKEKRQS